MISSPLHVILRQVKCVHWSVGSSMSSMSAGALTTIAGPRMVDTSTTRKVRSVGRQQLPSSMCWKGLQAPRGHWDWWDCGICINVSTNAFCWTWPPRKVLVLTRTWGTTRQSLLSVSHHINSIIWTGNCNTMTYHAHKCGPNCNQLTWNWKQLPNDVSHYNIWISCCNLCSGNTHGPQAILLQLMLWQYTRPTSLHVQTCIAQLQHDCCNECKHGSGPVGRTVWDESDSSAIIVWHVVQLQTVHFINDFAT